MIGTLTTTNSLASLLIKRTSRGRIIAAIAGPPGVGKSTFTEQLCDLINFEAPDICAILPMDGYHFDDIYLNKMGWRPRKGAPHTFDVGGYRHMLKRLQLNEEDEIAVPVFDRSIEIARAGARQIQQTAKIVLTEGNYLLLNQAPWDTLQRYFDFTIMLNAPRDVIIDRLHQRWEKHQYSSDELAAKMNENDLPNVDLVINQSIDADYVVDTNTKLS